MNLETNVREPVQIGLRNPWEKPYGFGFFLTEMVPILPVNLWNYNSCLGLFYSLQASVNKKF